MASARTQEMEEGASDNDDGNPVGTSPGATATPGTGRRGGRSATMGSDEWSRQRKDNHVGFRPSVLIHHL